MATDDDTFRTDVRTWLRANFPTTLKDASYRAMVEQEPELHDDMHAWRDALASRGYGAPTWPTEYGGA